VVQQSILSYHKKSTYTPPATTEPKRVGIWIRVSTEDQARGESPEHHERRARMYAEAKGWEVLRVYHLEAVSGKTVIGHPEAARMMEDIRSGRITGLIFSKLARLARNTRELLDFAEFFKTNGADLISLQESIDTSSPAGRLFYTMIAAMAQWEREEIADRVAASVPIRAKLGKPLGGAAPFGYRWEDGKLLVDPAEAPVRKVMYELFREHKRLKTVARLLTDAGHRTRSGAPFSDTTVRRLIEDPTATGRRRANYTRSTGEGKQWQLKPESEWVWTEVPAIIPEDLFRECTAILAERAEGKTPPKRTVHLFTGVAFCGCGRKLYVPSNTPKYVCYGCRTKIPVVDLERIFSEELRNFFLDPEEIAGHLAEGDRVLAEKRDLLATLEGERDRLAAESDKLYRLYLADDLSSEGFGKRNRPLEERLAQLGEEIPRLQGEIDFMSIQHLSGAEVLTEAQDLYSRWPDLSFDEKRGIVETIVEKITVGKDEVTMDLAYLPSPPEIMAERQRGPRDSLPPGGRSGRGSGGGLGRGRR